MVALPAPAAPTRAPRPDRADDLPAIKAALAGSIEALCLDLMGKPAEGGKRAWRYGRAGSLKVEIAGRKAGTWFSHEETIGGGPLDLVMRARGVDFREAVEWARGWIGGSIQSAPQVDHQRLHEDELREEAARIAHARAMWGGAGGVVGTLAARYLVETRAIPLGAVLDAAAADVIRFHPAYATSPDVRASRRGPAVLFKATDPSGELVAIQAVRLDPETGGKITRTNAKITNGVLSRRGGAVRLPGEGSPIIAEGPETGLSVWASTRRPVLIALGGIAKMIGAVPRGSTVTLARDGDPAGSPADLALGRAADELVAAGVRVLVAPPPAFEDLKKADFNDVLRRDGPAAVATIIGTARPWGAPTPPPPSNDDPRPPTRPGPPAREFPKAAPHYAAAPMPVEIARGRLQETIEAWIADALDWMEGMDPRQVGIKAAAGLGKSHATALALATHPAVAERNVEVYVPNHKLAAEWAEKLCEHAPHLRVQVIRGREREDLDGPMCRRAKAATAVARMGAPVYDSLCSNKDTGQTCPFFGSCRYLEQFADPAPAVRIMVHEYLGLPRQRGLPKPDLVVVDEAFWRVGITHRSLGIDRLTSVRKLRLFDGKEDPGAIADLLVVAGHVRDALLSGKPLLAELRARGVTAEMLRAAAKTEFGGWETVLVTPEMDDDVILSRISQADRSDALRLYRLWKLLETEIDLPRDVAHGVELRRDDRHPDQPDGERQDRVHLHWRQDIRIHGRPVLALDADLDAEIGRAFLPHLDVVHLPVERRATVIQVADTVASKRRLLKGTRPDDDTPRDLLHVVAMIEGEAGAGRRVLTVAPKAVAERLKPMIEGIPGVDLVHFGAVRGLDQYRDHDTVIVIGRFQPPPDGIEAPARGLWFDRPEPLRFLEPDEHGNRMMPGELRGYRTRSGEPVAANVSVHPDPDVQRLLEQIRECETAQAIDRLRLVHAKTEKTVIVLSSLVLDLTVDRLTTWRDLVGDPAVRMQAEGFIPCSPRDLAAAYPGEFATVKAAERWMERRGAICPKTTPKPLYEDNIRDRGEFWARWHFRVSGRRGPPSTILVAPHVSDPRRWIEERIGPVTALWRADPEPADLTRADEPPPTPAPEPRPAPALVVIEADGRRRMGPARASPAVELVPEPEPRIDPRTLFGPPVRPGYGVPPPPWLRLPDRRVPA
jgi:hypothetical protein